MRLSRSDQVWVSEANCEAAARPRASAEGTGNGERAIAYISDCHELPDETIERVKGVDVMVLNCLRERQHPTHLSLERALGYLDQIAPKRAYLVHMCHDLTHEDWLARLAGTNVEPAYDGLELKV